MPAASVSGDELPTFPLMTFAVPAVATSVVHVASEYTRYVTPPVAFAAFVPDSTAESVAGCPAGSVILAPDSESPSSFETVYQVAKDL